MSRATAVHFHVTNSIYSMCGEVCTLCTPVFDDVTCGNCKRLLKEDVGRLKIPQEVEKSQ